MGRKGLKVMGAEDALVFGHKRAAPRSLTVVRDGVRNACLGWWGARQATEGHDASHEPATQTKWVLRFGRSGELPTVRGKGH